VNDRFVYLSGPITAKHGFTVEENTAAAVKVHLDLISRGIWNFCPHLSAAFPSAFSVDYETWMRYDLAVIDRCTHIVMLPRWETSDGAVRERDYAISKGKTVTSVEGLLADHYEMRLL
jgi:hypothetical protein